jgi:hypothetical protein
MRRDTRLSSAWLCLARRKHRLLYCCVITGACFNVTVLAWRKYTTILRLLLNLVNARIDAFVSGNKFLYICIKVVCHL